MAGIAGYCKPANFRVENFWGFRGGISIAENLAPRNICLLFASSTKIFLPEGFPPYFLLNPRKYFHPEN